MSDEPKPIPDAERLLVQLAGCLTAAEGNFDEEAHKGDYGWSPAYEAVKLLRHKYDALLAANAAEKVAAPVACEHEFVEPKDVGPIKWCGWQICRHCKLLRGPDGEESSLVQEIEACRKGG